MRERNPIERAKAYVRVSLNEPANSANRQQAAIRRYARTQKLRIALILLRPEPSQT